MTNKRQKTDGVEDESMELPQQEEVRQFQTKIKTKGKDKVDEMEKDICAICLADDAIAARGKLDCCQHYFCFKCIIEWAKVESRCPTCKRRFNTIFRPYKTGDGARGRTVTVPLRDQVYIPSEDDSIGISDSYADVFCTECNNTGDDNLLLLCDLCDSAAHTYCVGLGRTVPIGDWYCRVCEASRPGDSNAQEDEADNFVLGFHNDADGSNIRSMPEEVSITEIVAERFSKQPMPLPSLLSRCATNTRPIQVRRLPRRLFRRALPRLSDAARALARQTQASLSTTATQVSRSASQVSTGGARTLSGQRMLQERIQAMRENWGALQSGELQFSSCPFSNSNNRADNGTGRIVQPESHNCTGANRDRRSNEADVDQAWAMMERAKSLISVDVCLDTHQKAGNSHWVTSSSCMKGGSSEIRQNSSPRVVASRTSAGLNSNAGSTTTALQNTSVSNGKTTPIRFMNSSTKRAVVLPENSDCQEYGNQGPTNMTNKKENVERMSKEISCRKNHANALPGPSSPSNIISTPTASTATNVPGLHLKGTASFGSQHNETAPSAKDRVQSLVKFHLNPVYRSKRLGTEQYKEIAKFSTHTILAACGLEHHESRVYHFQKILCSHLDQECQSSSLMPMCCNECFDSFVKDVVNKIAEQKLRT
eukprot:Gb_26794 [translate_table: standard]